MASIFGSKCKSLNDHVNPTTRRTIDHSAGGKLRDRNAKESWALLEEPPLYDNESWNNPMDFAKPVKAISLPQDVPMNKISSSCEICSGPHDTQYCMKNPEQAFIDYASLRTDEAGGKWYTFKPWQNNLGDTYNSSWKSHPNLRLSKFEADFKQQQSKMTNKIDTVLKAITDRITGALPSDTVKNPNLNVKSTSPVLSVHSYLLEEPQAHSIIHSLINAITICPKQPNKYCIDKSEEEEEEKGNPENININPPSPPDLTISLIIEKEDDGDVMFIEIIKKYDDSREEELEEDENTMAREMGIIRRKLNPREDMNTGVSNFTRRVKGMHIFVGNFTYVPDFMIVENISSIIDPRLSQVVLGKPFIEVSNMAHDLSSGVVRFTNGAEEITYNMPHTIMQYNSLLDLEKEHTKYVYFRNEEDKRRGVDYVMSKILGFCKECLDLRPEYLTGLEDEGGFT
ncbi:hypothetical protein Tco_0059058 [Tanacetum coccineum]